MLGSARRRCLQPAEGGGDPGCPWPPGGEAEAKPAAAADDASGGGEQAQSQPLGFPAAGAAGKGEQLGPGDQLAGQGDDVAPDLVPRIPVQRQAAQPGVLGAPVPVLAPGAAAVP